MASPFLTAPSPAFPSPGAFAVPPPPNPLPGLNGHAQSPSAFLTTSPAPTAPHPPPTTAHRPSPLPSFNTFLAPTPRATRLPPPPGAAPTASGRTGPSAGLQVEDPGTEARRAVGVLLGAGGEGAEGAEGLLQRVEKDVMGLLEGLENAFVESQPEIDPTASLATLSTLLSLLSRSSIGGFVPPSPLPPPSASSGVPPPTLSQTHVDEANKRVGELWREVQRVREHGEAVKGGLTG